MVFCYKIITESPRRSLSVSPRKGSPTRLPDISSTLSKWMFPVDYNEFGPGLLDDIAEREWRLLAALAKKREQDNEREKMAVDLHRMWEKEKKERDLVAAVTSEQYKRYIQAKRQKEDIVHYFKNIQRETESKMKQGLLIHSIQSKEQRSADLLNWSQDKKAHEIVEKAIDQEARGLLAADRRWRKGATDDWKRRIELEDNLKRIEDAQKRRKAKLKDASQRLAISNVLNSWDALILKHEVAVVDEYKRALHAAHAELTNLRSARLAQARDWRQKRARRLATITEQLRDAVKMNRS